VSLIIRNLPKVNTGLYNDEPNLNYEYMKEANSKRMKLKIQMYFDIFLNEVLEYTTGN